MPHGHKLLLWFVVSSAAAFAWDQAQKPGFADPGALPFIVRIQRTRSGKGTCAIVRGDGLFHVEQETSNHLEIAEGILDDGELAALKTVLSEKELAALTQQKIPVPLMITERDVLQISILRSPVTQNLTFLDRESRSPFDEFIDPLLHWMDILQKHPQTKVDEYSGRNNCLPPRKIEFSARRAGRLSEEASPAKLPELQSPTQTTAAPASRPGLFLMRWQFNHIVDGAVEDTCVVVYPSGQFRMEKSNQRYREELRVRAFESSLSETDLRQLKELLDEPPLKSSTHQNFPSGKTFREGELTTLAVSRDGGIQQLSFANYFGVPGFVSNISSGTDPEERLVKPLRKWLKSRIETRKLDALPDASATRCIALPQAKLP
jgi:hypothetical protein